MQPQAVAQVEEAVVILHHQPGLHGRRQRGVHGCKPADGQVAVAIQPAHVNLQLGRAIEAHQIQHRTLVHQLGNAALHNVGVGRVEHHKLVGVEADAQPGSLDVVADGRKLRREVRLPGKGVDLVRAEGHDARPDAEEKQALGHVPFQHAAQAGQVGGHGRRQALIVVGCQPEGGAGAAVHRLVYAGVAYFHSVGLRRLAVVSWQFLADRRRLPPEGKKARHASACIRAAEA